MAGLASRLRLAWFRSVEDLVFTGGMSFDVWETVFLTGMLAWTTAFVIFGILIIRGSMPTWLGIVLIACGFLPYLGFLPMWYYVGAIVLGITNLVYFREARSAAAGRQPTTTA